MLQNRLDALKAETPKLLAFYNGLDDKQKAAFDALRSGMGRRGPGMMGHGGMMGPGRQACSGPGGDESGAEE
jgi:hypothetical protein